MKHGIRLCTVCPTCARERFENVRNYNGFEQLCRNYAAEKVRESFIRGVIGDSGSEKRQRAVDGRDQDVNWVCEAAVRLKESHQLLYMFEGGLGVRDDA